ncbi:MAG: SH3 domain-containing protein, partial [Betaproteobacteria bacterium]
WYQVKAASAQGWVRMLSVRRGQAGKSNTAKDVAGLATGRAGTGQIVSTTGVRGLSEEELKQAKYDAAELQQAEAFAVSKADAGMFAQKAQLAARPFNYLPAN